MMLKHTYRYRYFLFLLLIITGCKDTDIAPQPSLAMEEEQLLLGNPSGATADEGTFNNYLMQKPQFALS